VILRVSQRMTKAMRLRRRPEYVAVQSSGRKVHGKLFMALVVETSDDAPIGRVGLTVTKRIGNAVIRNRIKRRAREWLRRHGWVPARRDVVFVAKEAAAGASSAEFGTDLARMIARLAPC
jgi:ribonuclease P protein component